MEAQEIFDSEEERDNDISCSESKKKRTASELPSYIKSYSRTQIESTVLDHTWTIDKFTNICKIYNTDNTLESILFSEKDNEYKVIMEIIPNNDPSLWTIKLHLRNTKSFDGLFITTVMYPPETVLLSRPRFSRALYTNTTLLAELSRFPFQFNSNKDKLVIHFKFEIFHNMINDSIHMKLLQPSTVFSKDVEYLEDSILDEIQSKDEESFKFIIDKEEYVVSKKVLYDTNSNFFRHLFLTHVGNEKDMTVELKLDEEKETFKWILLYLKTGSVESHDYNMLKKLLITANKYDVLGLKFTCEHYLLHFITIQNAVELIQLAFSTKAKFLEAHSASFIKFHLTEIMDTKEFQNLPKKDSRKLIYEWI